MDGAAAGPPSVFDGFARPACADLLGWRLLDADEETGTIRVAFDGRRAFCNPGGHVQGGFVAAMLDDTLGPTILVKTRGSHYGATIDLHVSFLAPARPGAFTGVGRVVRLGRTVAFLEGDLFDAAGGMVARATASARVVSTRDVPRA